MDRILCWRQADAACHPDRDFHASQRTGTAGGDTRRAAKRQHILSRQLPKRRSLEPVRSGGHPRRQGVCAHEAGGSRLWLTVSIKQRYGGHSKQAGLLASQCYAGGYTNRWVIVVDDDIDPTNTNDVLWAMCTRFDPRMDMEQIDGCWSTSLDPMCYDGDTDKRNSRVVIDACRPWDRMEDFPIVARSSRELDDRIREKWAHVLPSDV